MALSVTKSVNGRNQNAATCQFDQDKVRSELSYWLVANPSKYSRKTIPGSAILAAAIWAAGRAAGGFGIKSASALKRLFGVWREFEPCLHQ